jgi:glycosyltransferase involved in cell wall biosynthesis
MVLLEFIFWGSLALTAYTLVGYPVLTVLLAALVRKRVDKRPCTPGVSFIIAAYNEERVLEEKLRQTLELDYPSDKLEVIVASDGSTDGTDEIARSFADRGVRLHRTTGRLGKTATLNETVPKATGEILIFSDATGVFNRESIRELVANFADPQVGCVTGRVSYRYGRDVNSRGFQGYQRLAVAVRRAETLFGSQTSVSGSIHAVRRSLYRPARPDFSLDVIDAVHAVIQRHRVVYEYNAVSLEESRSSLVDEFRCRVRIGVRGTAMIPYVLGQLLRHGRFGYAFQMVSHKMLRWWLWLLLLLLLASNMALAGQARFYAVTAVVQAAGYGAAVLGLAAGKRLRLPLLSTASFFVMANAAMAVGAIKGLAGRRMAKWEPVR